MSIFEEFTNLRNLIEYISLKKKERKKERKKPPFPALQEYNYGRDRNLALISRSKNGGIISNPLKSGGGRSAKEAGYPRAGLGERASEGPLFARSIMR